MPYRLYIADHASRMRRRLADKVREIINVPEVVISIGEEVQAAEDALHDTGAALDPDFAAADQLRRIGNLLGVRQLALADAIYRRFVRAALIRRRTTGRTEDLLAIAKLIIDAEPLVFQRNPPAAYTLAYVRPSVYSSSYRARIREEMEAATASGVGINLVEGTGEGIDNLFRLDISEMDNPDHRMGESY